MNRAPCARTLICSTTFAFIACQSRPDAGSDKPRQPAAASSTSAGSNSASAAPSASASPSAWYVGTWEGDYTTRAATPSVEPGFGLAEWSRNPGTAGVGTGSVTLSVDLDGTVTGTAKGALGRQIVRGAAEEHSLHLELTPSAPSDGGFTGVVVVATAADSTASGSFRASGGNSRWVREGTLTLKKK